MICAAFCIFGDINIYGDEMVTEMPCLIPCPTAFRRMQRNSIRELLNCKLHTISRIIIYQIGDIEFVAYPCDARSRCLSCGYRFGKFAYITDMKSMGDEEYAYLDGVETLGD